MPKMIVSIDGVVIKEVQLTKDRTTLGRRPYNDIVIDNLAVSGEHAVVQMAGSDVYLEDLNSTNGTYVNGKAVKKQLLRNGDSVEVGKYKIKFVNEAVNDGFEKGIEKGIEQGFEKGIEKGIVQGFEKGIEKGIEQGREEERAAAYQERLNTARNLKQLGVSNEQIAQASGLPLSVIADL